jgi:hypothetical protein
MKKCTKCEAEKNPEEFAFKSKAKGTRHSQCKECHKLYSKGHYNDNLIYYKDKSRKSKTIVKVRNKEFVNNYLLANPCIDCGERDIEVLQFDHKELIGNGAKRVYSYMDGSLENLKKEIAKCEPRCGNCHIRRTRKQLGWFRIMPL